MNVFQEVCGTELLIGTSDESPFAIPPLPHFSDRNQPYPIRAFP